MSNEQVVIGLQSERSARRPPSPLRPALISVLTVGTVTAALTPLALVPLFRLSVAIVALVTLLCSRSARDLALRPRSVTVLAGVAVISAILGPNPLQALRGVTGMVAELAAGATVAAMTLRAGHTRAFDRALRAILLVVVLLTAARALGSGDGAPWSDPSIFTQKNEAGLFAAFFLATLPDASRRRWPWGVAGAALLVLTGSRAALVAVICSTVAVAITRRLYLKRRTGRTPSRAPAIALVTILLVACVLLRGDIIAALGRSPDLTGRTQIWEEVAEGTAQRPLIGGGPGGVIYEGSPLAEAIEQSYGRPLWTTQSGYLSVALSVGAVGSVLYLLMLGSHLALIDRMRSALAHRRMVEAAVATLVVYLVMNLTEDVALGHAGLFFVSYSLGRLRGVGRAVP